MNNLHAWIDLLLLLQMVQSSLRTKICINKLKDVHYILCSIKIRDILINTQLKTRNLHYIYIEFYLKQNQTNLRYKFYVKHLI